MTHVGFFVKNERRGYFLQGKNDPQAFDWDRALIAHRDLGSQLVQGTLVGSRENESKVVPVAMATRDGKDSGMASTFTEIWLAHNVAYIEFSVFHGHADREL